MACLAFYIEHPCQSSFDPVQHNPFYGRMSTYVIPRHTTTSPGTFIQEDFQSVSQFIEFRYPSDWPKQTDVNFAAGK